MTNQITWDDSYSVNNAEIDAQHQKWIEIHNKLDYILLKGNNAEVSKAAADTLQAMQEYVNSHFRAEEQYMKEINYPDLVVHKRLHTDFDDYLYSYQRKVRSGELVLNSELMSILKEWLLNHILHEDQKYRAFLMQN
ncbi:MAG: bacteriohemerythrin [Proteobacteria bacterium]|nr:bacteriohemerythrin [Pseudomonadota bacterium]MBU1648611.1 bacteriohemerythrin [Pseudomonadota bacterium]